MKYCSYPLLCAGLVLCAGLALAQSNTAPSSIELTTVDINGHRVTQAQYASRDGDRTELTQSINGSLVPLKRSETRVLSEAPNHRVTETIVRTYDGAGVLASTERTVTDEQKRAGGSTINATVYRSDGNGRLQEGERRTIESQTQGGTTTADVTIARPGLSGSFVTAEKRQVVTAVQGDVTRETESVQRLSDGNGQMYDAARYVREATKAGDKTTASTTMFEPDNLGRMSLVRREVATTSKSSDGAQVTERSLYAPNQLGIARDQQGGERLSEQQTIIRRQTGSTVTETTSVRRPALGDANRLGDPTVISNLACTGKCEGPLQQQKP